MGDYGLIFRPEEQTTKREKKAVFEKIRTLSILFFLRHLFYIIKSVSNIVSGSSGYFKTPTENQRNIP